MAPLAVRRVHFRLMRLVAREALGLYGAVRRTEVERLAAPVSVAARARARLARVRGARLRVRIVAHATRAAVRIACRVERLEQAPHFVTREALSGAGPQHATGGITGRKPWHVRGELMTGGAMEGRLILHAGELNARSLVAAAAGLIGRDEVVHFRAMAGDAQHVP